MTLAIERDIELDKQNSKTSGMGVSRALVVLGMHRSGTSAITRVLNLFGLDLGTHLMAASEYNPMGHWEHLKVVEINEKIYGVLGRAWSDTTMMPQGWMERAEVVGLKQEAREILKEEFGGVSLWGMKDPRLCMTLPFWREVMEEMGTECSALLVLRHPWEVAQSLATRDSMSMEQGLLLWLVHVLESERATRDMPRSMVMFDQILDEWRSVTSRIGRELGLRWPVSAETVAGDVQKFLAPSLRHHRRQSTVGSSQVGSWCERAYEAIQFGLRGDTCTMMEMLDEVNGEMLAVPPLVQDYLRKLEPMYRGMRNEYDQQAELLRKYMDEKPALAELGDGEKQLQQLKAELGRVNDSVGILRNQVNELRQAAEEARRSETQTRQRFDLLRQENLWLNQRLDHQAREAMKAAGANREQLGKKDQQVTALQAELNMSRQAINRLQGELRVSARRLEEALRGKPAVGGTLVGKVVTPLIAAESGLKKRLQSRGQGDEQVRKAAEQVRESGIFDETFYLAQGAAEGDLVEHFLKESNRWPGPLFDVNVYRESVGLGDGVNPLVHYLNTAGAVEARTHVLFDGGYYLRHNPDVAAEIQRQKAGGKWITPLGHYLRFGADEGRDPHPLFDSSYYLEKNPDVAAAGVNALAHYITKGEAEGRKPNALFDPHYYIKRYPEVVAQGWSPLVHYWVHGGRHGFSTCDLFDGEYYLNAYPDVKAHGVNPLAHFLENGAKEGGTRHPNALFDSGFYLQNNPDVAALGMNPLLHYVLHGAKEGREFSPSVSMANLRAGFPGVADTDLLATVLRSMRNTPQTPKQIQPVLCAFPRVPRAKHLTVGLISGMPGTPMHQYRVSDLADAAKASGHHPFVVAYDKMSAQDIDRLVRCDVLVLYRTPWTGLVSEVVSACRESGGTIVYDIDDYVFDHAVANRKFVDGLRYLNDQQMVMYDDGVRQYRHGLLSSDHVFVPTEFLASRVSELGRPVSVIRNGFPQSTLELSKKLREDRKAKPNDGKLRIGYASGTRTHQRDFASAAGALARILNENPHVVLTIVGQLDLADFPALSGLGHRIEKRELVPLEELSRELVRFDINIAPLELDNPYCDAKSELKYFEAALVGVPTLASASDTFARAIDHGKTGLVAKDEQQWFGCLCELVNDAELRNRLASAAYEHAQKVYGPEAKAESVGLTLERIIANVRINRGSSRERKGMTFVLPPMIKGSGGHGKIIAISKIFAQKDYDVLLHFTGGCVDYPTPASLASEYGLDKARVNVVYHTKLPFATDLSIASQHSTVYAIRDADVDTGARCHYMQDFEAMFYPMGTEHLRALNALKQGFTMISNGPWVKEIIRRRLDLPTLDIPFAIDKRIYKPIPSITRRKDLLLYFSRPDMPRRCYDLGIAALRMIQEKMGDAVEIAFFGSKYSPGTEGLRYTQLGILRHEDLAKLYNTATAALVFSPTNPSMAPYEMISSGLPIIDIDVELNDWNYGGKDNVFLCQVEASDIANTAVRVMQDEQLRNETIARAQKFVAEKFLDEEGCVSCLIKIFDKAIRVSETEGHKDLSGGLDMYDAR